MPKLNPFVARRVCRPALFPASMILLLVPTGCRQTANTAAGVPLQPFTNPGGVTGPALSPFGGAAGSRVAPPATGSVTPNNYMGGTGIGPTTTGYLPATSSGSVSDSLQPIGSGVAQAGYQGGEGMPHSAVALTAGQSPVTPSLSPANGSPTDGRMRVIDLTGAPAPPGYQAPAGYPGQPAYPAVAGQPTAVANSLAPINPGNTHPAPITAPPATAQAIVPASVSTASGVSPSPAPPRPSTRPVASGAPTRSTQLKWRRPQGAF